jgi:quercetin dioxygenase-like cupin family protein
MQQNYRRTGIGVAAAATVLLLGITVHSAISTNIGIGNMDHSDIVGGPATVTMRTLEFAPGEVSGWHYHTGLGALNVVTQGALAIEDGCGGETVYQAGEAFLETPGRVHRGRNVDNVDMLVVAQTFLVAAGEGLAVATGRLCGQPASVVECRQGGWTTFNQPRAFASQGDCEQFVITGK